MWNLPWGDLNLSWLKPWDWPERIIKSLETWHEMKEASAKRRVAEAQAAVAEKELAPRVFEANVTQTMREIRKLQNAKRKEHPSRNMVLEIKPAPDDNPEVFDEAMRRIRYASGR
jgi:hypothetical protein